MAFQAPTPTETSAKASELLEKSKSPSNYFDLKTPEDYDEDIESGALRAGGAPSIWSMRNIGVLVSFCCVTVVYGMSLSILYAVMNNYLYMSGLLVATAKALVQIPRVLRVFLSALSDIYPIFGYRRRPYMVIGWSVAFVACFIMAVIPLGDPYYEDASLEDIDLADMTSEQLALVHTDAPHQGTKFIFLFMLANLGAVIAYGPTYGIFIELSQREPEHIRGRLQTNVFMVRNALAIVTAFLTGLCLNSTEYGGTFSWSIGFNGIMWICTAVCLITIPFCWFCVAEEKVEQTKSIGTFYKEIYEVIQQQPFYRLFIFRYFTKILGSVSVTASSNIQSIYAQVTPLNDGLAACLSQVLVVAGIFSIKKWGLQWNWQYLAIFSQLFAVFVDAFPTYFTIWNVFRSQWFWLGVPLLEDFVGEFVDYATTITMVEIADPGREATSMGFLGSITAAAKPFGTVITKSVDSYFDIGQTALKRDDHAVHMDLSYAYIIAYLFNIVAVVFAFLLPRQKHEAQAMKQNGGKSKLIGTVSVVIFLFSVAWAIMTHLLSLWDSTSCLRIAGDEEAMRQNRVLFMYGNTIANFIKFLQKQSKKSFLKRLASNRKVVAAIQDFNEDIDDLYKLLNLVHIQEMSKWKQEWEENRRKQEQMLVTIALDQQRVQRDIQNKDGDLLEGLAMLKFEIQHKSKENSIATLALMKKTFKKVVRTSKAKVPPTPEWFIASDDVDFDAKNQFDCGSYGSVHRGTWGRGAKVVIKCLLMDDEQAKDSFFKEVEVWRRLNNPHIVELFGACHVSTPAFFVCEDAIHGNFIDYFETDKSEIWRLFYEAAVGLDYLHEQKVVHGDLKCNNILVGADDKAKICDFGFSYIRSQSVGLSAKAQTDTIRWKAPECLMPMGEENPDAEHNPRFASDVFSFGMCIIEAFSNEPPYGFVDDEVILEAKLEMASYDRPEGFEDDEWALVERLCDPDWKQRIQLSVAINELKRLADREAERNNEDNTDRVCLGCKAKVAIEFAFCGNCGHQVAPPA
ncbi:hypothetical protein BBO99_00003660 [Phytophthora kernoviae]|uniref:Protein kinase domain-containing protein n=1 Tax=Phytophthora kernoviae TaxID=325452 RepID=A0A3R7K0W6_9STRA|nr:hypothetical protein BBI17_003671 [Phytophthora kernoviae]RLN81512.1 hypothetical protein BBO99_00003660 [Phytophthora kernoviae]